MLSNSQEKQDLAWEKSYRRKIVHKLALFCARRIPGWNFLRRLQYSWKPVGAIKFRLAYRNAYTKGDVRLHVGAGYSRLVGWLNTDISPVAPLFLDATRHLPIKDNSVSYIFSEHFIEHIPRRVALQFLNESYRVLKHGGKIRISTPDIEIYAREYLNRSDSARQLMDYYNANEVDTIWHYRADILHQLSQGHSCLYDEEMLRDMLQLIGFDDIKRCNLGISQDSFLSGIEKHGVGTIEAMFTLSIEAAKPKG